MSKLNPKGQDVTTNIVAVAARREQQLGVSANGNIQFVKETNQQLYELMVTSMFGKGNQLSTADALVQRIKTLTRTVAAQRDFDFIANLAVHARTEMNIRTMPIVLVVEFAKALSDNRAPVLAEIQRLSQLKRPSKKALDALRAQADELNYGNMRKLVADVIRRADQITDMYAYALAVFGDKKKIPIAIKRGVADAFNKFNEYAFAKYNRAGSVKLRDVLRIVHPNSKDVNQGVIFSKIMSDTLSTPYTWETQLSANGQLPEKERLSNKALWTELVKSGQIGYMALLRNLRNIHSAGLDADVLREYVLDVIADPERVAKSKQLPYDFMEAYKIVKPLDAKLATAVSKAIDASASNIPLMGEKVWLIVDFSGSMGYEHVDTSAFSGGIFLASALLKANANADNLAVTLFGSSAMTLNGVDTNNSMIAIQKELAGYRKGSIGGATHFEKALDEKSKLPFEPDTIIVITDGEVNGFPYRKLKNVAGNKVMKMTVNMSAAFTTPMVKEDGWYTLAGWNTSMFNWVPRMREGQSAVEALSGPYGEA